MPIRPFLLLYRTRLLFAAVAAVLFAVAVLMLTSAESPTDFGVLWHHFCGCPPDPSDARVLLYISTIMCVVIGLIMGFGPVAGGTAQTGGAAHVNGTVYGEMRLLLTRPLRRASMLLTPIALATAAIVVLPAAALLILLAWLHLVHAPSLGHLVEVARLVPGTAAIGDRPSLTTILAATHYLRYYAASVSVGLSFFALYYAQRWWLHSRYKGLRVASAFVFVLLPMLPPLTGVLLGRGRLVWILMTNKDLSAPPSALSIGLHLLFAAACLASCWKIAQEIEV